jgi:hypothetical protein
LSSGVREAFCMVITVMGVRPETIGMSSAATGVPPIGMALAAESTQHCLIKETTMEQSQQGDRPTRSGTDAGRRALQTDVDQADVDAAETGEEDDDVDDDDVDEEEDEEKEKKEEEDDDDEDEDEDEDEVDGEEVDETDDPDLDAPSEEDDEKDGE